ncbi:MAG TPA: 2-phospho-L-lactate transferase [Capillimicrobium sp.]|nr:2-phospho-L-lactate transferase [Capillimicrobium sp.]
MGGSRVVVLAGGTGGAKLARGMLDVVGEDLTVVANTGDDVEIYGSYVSPDPDLVTFWLADRIDGRGWGLDGDTFHVMDGLRELGDDVWFNLGDRDLACCVRRARRLAEGATLTDAIAEQAAAFGVAARVLPMADAPVRTRVRAGGAWWSLQRFLIQRRGEGPVEDVAFDGAGEASPTQAVLDAIAAADAIVIGPSNPIISIGPILALPGLREALAAAAAPVVAVSPIVQGQVLKGPTAAFLAWAGRPATAAGVAGHYAGIADGFVCDEQLGGAPMPVLATDVELGDAGARARVAEAVLDFARALR